MKGKHMNRQATRRISIPVTVCLTLLASCVSKPIEQDLASGDATVEIKYLDSVTMDIIDDTRTKRRKFYEMALNDPDKKYSQGKQGAIDRESTFAAAINANAQRDKSVLERYSAEGNRQLSALENSEELGEALLDHHKESMKQLDALNAERVKGAASQAEALQKKNEYAGLMFEHYLSALKEIDASIGKEIEKDEKRTLLNAEIGRKTTESNNAATSTEDKNRLKKEIEIATTEKNALGDSKTESLRGVRENLLDSAHLAGFSLPADKELLVNSAATNGKGTTVESTGTTSMKLLDGIISTTKTESTKAEEDKTGKEEVTT
ncbi:hypothetical protein VU08_03405, partial [Desulfobulbus sp. F5]|nr:hypothetical protein [Desulfobulbus sp. F5]